MLDRFLDFFYGYTVGFLHVTAKFADLGQQFLRYRRRTVHHQVCVRDAGVDFLNAPDRKDVAGGLFGELVGAMAGANGNRQGITLRRFNKFGGLIRIGQQLFHGHLAFGTVTIFFIAGHSFQRAEHTQFTLNRDADAVRQLDYFARGFNVVLEGGNRFAIFHQRTVHHDRREARANGTHTDGRALAVILVHHHRNVRIRFERSQDLVAQEGLTGIFAGTRRGLHDDRRVELVGAFHNGPDLLHVVNVKCRQAVVVFGGVVEQLAQGNERHGFTPEKGCRSGN